MNDNEKIEFDDGINQKTNDDTNQNFENKKIKFNIFDSILIFVILALTFISIVYIICVKDKNSTLTTDNQSDISNNNNVMEEIEKHYNFIVDNYYQEVDKDELIKGAVEGMLSKLDDYSEFIDTDSNNFTITLNGEYEGLGIEIVNDINGNIIISGVFEDSPASKAGLKSYDIITKMNDIDLKNVATSDFINMIGSDLVKLTINRDGDEFYVELKKEKITIKSVSSEIINNNIGYIKVDIFANNTYQQFKQQLIQLENNNIESLIIDLRDNTGGYLTAVENMLSLFMDKTHIIYQTEKKDTIEKFYSKGKNNKTYKIVILQNEGSASASEIMSSALKEQLDAYIIGKASYGKGTVQQLYNTNDIGQYKFTTKKWLTSKGVWINEVGVKPDLEIELDEKYYTMPTKENDNQLAAAINYLKK